MEQIKILQKMTDAADLLAMVEDLLSNRNGAISQQSLAGIRVSIKNAREILLQGHDVIASQAMNRTRVEQVIEPSAAVSGGSSTPVIENNSDRRRKELRSMLEKFAE